MVEDIINKEGALVAKVIDGKELEIVDAEGAANYFFTISGNLIDTVEKCKEGIKEMQSLISSYKAVIKDLSK